MPVVGALAARLATAGLSNRAARVFAWAILLVILALIAWGAWALWLDDHDDTVIAADRSKATIETLNSTIAADRGAGAAKDARDRAFANEQDQLQKEVDDAAANGTSPLDALFDRLR